MPSNGHGGGVEPTPTQLAAASCLEDIAALVGMRQAAITHLVDLLGGEAVTIQDVAALPESDLSALLDPLHPAAETEFRPTLVDKARAIRLHRACREKVERRHSGAPPTHTAPSADREKAQRGSGHEIRSPAADDQEDPPSGMRLRSRKRV